MKIVKILFVFIFCFLIIDISAVHAYIDNNKDGIIFLRAGGSTSSNSSGTSGGRSYPSHSSYRENGCLGKWCLISEVFFWTCIFLLFFSPTILLYFKVFKASIYNRKHFKLLSEKAIAWDYKKMKDQVINAFYIIQQSWSHMDMFPAKEYMTESLYERFTTKLEWMKIQNKQNILEKIQLIDVKPISFQDHINDNKDYIWFYMKAKMIDYVIDSKTNKKIGGISTFRFSFIEFWKFTREGERWVLSKILQEDEVDNTLLKQNKS